MKRILSIFLCTAFVLTGCSTATAPTVTPDVPTTVTVNLDEEEPTGEPADEPSQPIAQKVKLFVVALEGQGDATGETFGCGDRLATIEQVITTPTDDLDDTITGSLNALFALTPAEIDASGYYSVFPDMSIETVGTLVEQRIAKVDLAGQPSFGGVCDTPRFYAQIDATIRQFSGIQDTSIRLNGSADAYQALGSQQ